MSNQRTIKAQQPDKHRRKYVAIAKVDKYTFVKYRFNDLTKFFEFLLKKFPGTLFVNVFSNKGADRRQLLFTWGKNKRLEKAK